MSVTTPSPASANTSNEQTEKEVTAAPTEKKSTMSALKPLLDKLPTWLTTAAKDPRKWKTFIRCMVCLFANLVLLVCQPSLESAGQAGFFGLIVACIAPPYVPLSVFLFLMLTIIMGMCIGWAWGVAAMAAALQARSKTLLASQYTRAQSSLSPSGANPDAQFQVFIFKGEFLDPRSTVVFGIFFFVGTYFMGSIRAIAPKMQYTIATQFLIPTGYYVAVAVACIILVFPQTLNHSLTDGYIKGVLKAGNGLVALQAKVLNTSPNDREAWSALTEKARAARHIFTGALAQIVGSTAMLELELLVGEEKKQDRGPGSESEAYENRTVDRLYKLQDKINEKERGGSHTIEQLLPILEQSSSRLRAACQGGLQGGVEWLEWTNTHRWHRGKKAYPKDESVQEGLQKRKAAIVELQDALEQFRTVEHIKLLEPFRSLFDPETGDFKSHLGNLSDADVFKLSSRSLFTSFVFVTNLISYSTTLIEFLQTLLEIEARSPQNKVQWPTAFRKIAKIAMSRGGSAINPLEIGTQDVDAVADSDSDDDDDSTTSTLVDAKAKAKEAKRQQSKDAKKKKYRLDPDAELPKNGLQRFLRTIGLAWRWQSSPEGLFALKYALVSIALWIPAICPSSAYFTYVNRGLWALIMSQTGLGVFAGEQIAGFIARMTGTLIGLVLGMIAWYMGSGHGNGNPYGVVAATLFVCAPFLFARVVAPQPVMAFPLMIAVTIVFTIGYSWVDTHLVVLANQGRGADVAWRRALLVIIGFTAGFIISLFPKPQSAKVTVRKSFAKAIDNIAELYTEEVKGFLLEARLYNATNPEPLDVEERASRYRTRFLGVMLKLQAISPQISNAKFEPALRGPWPKAKYEALMARIQELLGALALLSNSWTRMRGGWAKVLVDDTPFFEPNFVSLSDCLLVLGNVERLFSGVQIADSLGLLSLITHSLRDGREMPASLPLAERLATHSMHKHQHGLEETFDAGHPHSGHNDSTRIVRDAMDAIPDNADGASLRRGHLNWRTLQDEQLAIYATASIALSHIAFKIDQIHGIVRSLVGEQRFDALEDLSRERAMRDAQWLAKA
ncbi:hypothetical protein QFC22_004671 [Naganishia vaughanmartiniae]|uniref:Uncharacterized protein n=1 Tax=Naganishia vaughanmartiniae TaxID=1424756 RepID=A0ACC2WZU1_9TREE|nr:hypothetical protein QFC22_004671 [Naganishia vaughanmartiniae]